MLNVLVMGAASSATPCSCEESAFHSKYVVGKMLGKGSQGKVHICVERKTGQTRAVKIIDRSWRAAWTTYRREVELCKAASSSHVISIFEEFVDNSYCYVVMERLEGHLRKGLKWVAKECGGATSPLGEDNLRNVVRQTLVAIQHLHSCSIIHRDVKSHNLLVDRLDLRDERCRVVLGDLGLARRLEPGRFLCSQVGTRKYWAPELYEKKYWHVVDVFAVGVLIFLATCSSYPFLDEEQTRNRDIWKEGVVPPVLGEEAQGFLRLLLQKDPQLRPSASELLDHKWAQTSFAFQTDLEQGPINEVDFKRIGHSLGGRAFGPKLRSLGEVSPPRNLVEFADDGLWCPDGLHKEVDDVFDSADGTPAERHTTDCSSSSHEEVWARDFDDSQAHDQEDPSQQARTFDVEDGSEVKEEEKDELAVLEESPIAVHDELDSSMPCQSPRLAQRLAYNMLSGLEQPVLPAL